MRDIKRSADLITLYIACNICLLVIVDLRAVNTISSGLTFMSSVGIQLTKKMFADVKSPLMVQGSMNACPL